MNDWEIRYRIHAYNIFTLYVTTHLVSRCCNKLFPMWFLRLSNAIQHNKQMGVFFFRIFSLKCNTISIRPVQDSNGFRRFFVFRSWHTGQIEQDSKREVKRNVVGGVIHINAVNLTDKMESMLLKLTLRNN